jgi:hypothetical protein
VEGEGVGWRVRERVEEGEEMTQTLYAHMNKKKKEHKQQQMLVKMWGKRNPHTLLV